MFEKIVVSVLLVMLVFATLGIHSIHAQTDADTAGIRAKVSEYGFGERVTVTLMDKTKFKGRISQIEQDTFSLKDKKTGTSTAFAYSDVARVKKGSLTKWIVIGVAAAVAAAIIIPLSIRCRNEGANALCQ